MIVKYGHRRTDTELKDILISDVPDGWHDLVMKLAEDLYKAGWDGHLYQTKEKFGGLRFYIESYNEKLNDLINAAEELSYVTCSVCGETGKMRNTSWVNVLCDKHYVVPL